MTTRALAAVALVLALAGPAAAGLETIPTRPGVTQSFMLLRRTGDAGGHRRSLRGRQRRAGVRAGRPGALGGNFLVRNRVRFAEHGFLVAIPDAPPITPPGSAASGPARSTPKTCARSSLRCARRPRRRCG